MARAKQSTKIEGKRATFATEILPIITFLTFTQIINFIKDASNAGNKTKWLLWDGRRKKRKN